MPASDRKTGSLGASVIVGGSAALSRILGFVREILIAALFGTGGVADALLVGLRLPNLLRRTLGEGGAQGALVPWLMHEKATRPPDDARRASGSLLVGLAIAAAILCIATILLRAPLTLLLAPGFTKAQSGFSLAAECLALSFPIVGASLLTAFATAWLALERAYVLASLTGLLVNMVLIAVLGWVQHFQVQEDSAARWIAGSMALAGLGQAAVLLWVILRQAAAPCLAVPDWRALAAVGKRLLPSLTVAAAPQLAFLIVLIPATQWAGSASQLIYAERVMQLPFGFIAAGLAMVALPELSRLHKQGEASVFVAQSEQAFLQGLALALPAAIGLVLLAQPITLVLFQRGAFSVTDASDTAKALQMLAFALPAMVGGRVFGQAFFAQQFYHAPLVASLCGLLAALFASTLARNGAELGLAYAGAMTLECVLVAVFAAQKLQVAWRRMAGPVLFKLVLSSGFMAVMLVYVLDRVPLAGLAMQDRVAGMIGLGLVIGASCVIYGLALTFCGLWRPLLAKNPSTTLHDA